MKILKIVQTYRFFSVRYNVIRQTIHPLLASLIANSLAPLPHATSFHKREPSSQADELTVLRFTVASPFVCYMLQRKRVSPRNKKD